MEQLQLIINYSTDNGGTVKPVLAYALTVKLFNAILAALIVRSISSSVCASDTNAASNCDGARYIPCPSIALKYAAYLAVSDVFALW